MAPRVRLDPEAAALRKRYMGVSEGAFQRRVTELLHLAGYAVFHDPDVHRCRRCGALQKDTRVPGFPDLFAARLPRSHGRGPLILMVELKAERGALSDKQKVWGAILSAAAQLLGPRFHYAVWQPHDLPLIETLLFGAEK